MRIKHPFYWVLAISFYTVVSCTHKPEIPVMKSASTDGYSQIVTDTLPAPTVTYISDFEAPEVIKAAEPLYDSLSTPFGRGTPDITTYTTLDGLPQSITSDVLQGPDGMMWFLSVENLSNFDGTTFTTFNRFNGLLKDTYSSAFLLDDLDRILIGSGNGLIVYDGRSFITYTTDNEGNDLGYLTTLIKDQDGSIWIGNADEEIFHYQNDQITRITSEENVFPGDFISKFLIDKNGTLVIVSSNNNIYQYDGLKFSNYTAIPQTAESEKSIFVFSDSMGNIWFHSGTERLGKYDGLEITYYTNPAFKSIEFISELKEDAQGDIWISTDEGLTYFDGASFINYKYADLGINNNSGINSIAFDREGSIWAVVPSLGVLKINRTLSFPEVPMEEVVRDVFPEPGGDIWIKNDKGLGKYEENRIALYGHDLISNERYRNINSPTFSPDGNLWFTIYDEQIELEKLVKFDGSDYTLFGPDQGMTSDLVDGCFRLQKSSRSDRSLIHLCRDKVFEFDGEKIIRQNFLPDISLNAYLEDQKGNLWFGTQNNGIYKYDGEQLSQFNTKTGLVSNSINRLTEDQSGNIWATIDYGNARITNDSVRSFDALDGLANLTAQMSVDTLNNVLWFGTISGLVSLDYSQLNEDQPRFRRYNDLTGFSIGPIAEPEYDAEGRIWGDSRKLFQFDYPTLIDVQAAKPFIKDIQLNNQPVSWLSLSPFRTENDSLAAINEMGLKFGEKLPEEQFKAHFNSFKDITFDTVHAPNFIPVNLSLPYANNTISFEFATISPTYGISTQYQFRLAGYDDRWSPLSTKKEANFGNLPEGSYTFELKALNANGIWSETSYPFTIRSPWYRSWWAYLSYLLAFGMGVFGFISWRTRSLNREKDLLESEVAKRTSELQQSNIQLSESLSKLKSAQQQLVQQEKLASLGQLTAGIAHEIKNPLNFVNNFSDISVELIDEAKEELSALIRKVSDKDRKKVEETLEILNDIDKNLRKIHQHGTRADSIVKSMLEHSRGGDGHKEPTDLNALVKEYVNLSFHGMRAGKDPINVDLGYELDESIEEIPLVAEDFSRVIVNLCNNAFDAMRSKLNEDEGPETNGYSPKLTVSTKKSGKEVVIQVEDNGPGIPEEIKDQILQPFFTTKKGTEGTGLGLSITNDIIKAHGGSIDIRSKAGNGSTFTIHIPNHSKSS